MGVVIKQSFWGTVIAYVGVLVGYVNTLYLRPEFFSLDQIGLFTLVTANAMMISPFCLFGMSGSYIKFFPSFKENTELRSQIFTFQFLLIIAINLLIIVVAFANSDWIVEQVAKGSSEYVNYLAVTAVIIVVNSLFEHLFAYSSTIMKVIFPSFLREVFLRLGAIVLVIGYAGNYFDFDWAVKGLAINYSIVLVLLIAQLVASKQLRFSFSLSLVNGEWRKRIIRFATYSMGMAVSFAVLNNASYNQVSSFLGDASNGIFVTCFFIGVIVEMPRRNMARVVSPILSNTMMQQDLAETDRIYKKSSITMSAIGFLLFIGIMTNLDDLFSFIPQGEAFQKGYGVVLAVCGAKVIVMIGSFSGEIINYSPFYRLNLVLQIVSAMLLVAMNYYLIPIFGLDGVAISYFTTILLHSFAKFLVVWVRYRIHPFMKSHLLLLMISGVVFFGFSIFSLEIDTLLKIVVRSILTTMIFVFSIYKFNVSEDINRLLDGLMKRFRI